MTADKPSSARCQREGAPLNRWRNNPVQSPFPRGSKCLARTRSGKPCQSPGMANGRCRMHGGPSPGAPKGNRNAFKHGRYTAEAIVNRRQLSAMLVTMKALATEVARTANHKGDSSLTLGKALSMPKKKGCPDCEYTEGA